MDTPTTSHVICRTEDLEEVLVTVIPNDCRFAVIPIEFGWEEESDEMSPPKLMATKFKILFWSKRHKT